MPTEVDLVITFRASPKRALSKQQAAEESRKAEEQYVRLLKTLSYAGLRAVGRRGEELGHLLIFVSCPKSHVINLIKRERHSDFLYGLPTSRLPSEQVDLDVEPLAPSDRLRLVHTYITSSPKEGGLGIIPGSSDWNLVESILSLHDDNFNEKWIGAWTKSQITTREFSVVRDQFGESVALYFAFLWTYTRFLIFPAALGALFWFFGTPYSPTYSCLLVVWSTVFTEYWRVRERILSLRFGTRGSFRVEKRRADHRPLAWWQRELRSVASVPVILVFAGLLTGLLTAMFIFEAFVTQLYTGPAQKLVGFSPTILFILLVPRFLGLYQIFARRFTDWENHAHQSSYDASLTIKTFVCSALVAYLGLALSAFVYVPFGEGVMRVVQVWLFNGVGDQGAAAFSSEKGQTPVNVTTADSAGIWEASTSNAQQKLNPGRLRDQMFAYTVTNQAIGTFLEVGLPFILRFVNRIRSKKGSANGNKKKRVVFEDEKTPGGEAEMAYLEKVRSEVALPEYELFTDYSEMVTQFGYVSLWSTIWPLAPLMAFVNNFFELRSDAYKITVHHRRPIPQRTDTIGPWLNALTFLTWLSALTNSSLVYLFCPRTHCPRPAVSSVLTTWLANTFFASSNSSWSPLSSSEPTPIERIHRSFFEPGGDFSDARGELFMSAVLIALVASHGYMALRATIRHVMERLFWKGSKEVEGMEERDRDVKEGFLRSMGVNEKGSEITDGVSRSEGGKTETVETTGGFWGHDEGIQEIRRIVKEA